jgi:hypothetical protein
MMLLAVLPSLLVSPSIPDGWRSYANPRFGFNICFPAELTAKGPPPDNGDGRVFADRAGVELAVWGEHDVFDDTIASAAKRLRGYLRDEGVVVTYSAKGKDWLALSGRHGQSIVYERMRFSLGRFVTFRLTYPASTAARWNPRIARISACFGDTAEGPL